MRSIDDFPSTRNKPRTRYHRSHATGSWVLIDRAWARQLGVSRRSGAYYLSRPEVARCFEGVEPRQCAGEWSIDPAQTKVRLTARPLVHGPVRGEFRELDGTIRVGQAAEECSIDLALEASSIETGRAVEDELLRSEKFLDADRHPRLEVRSRRLERVDGSGLRMAGDITIKGVTRPLTLKVDSFRAIPDQSGEVEAALEAVGKVDREEFDLAWNGPPEEGGTPIDRYLELVIEARGRRTPA